MWLTPEGIIDDPTGEIDRLAKQVGRGGGGGVKTVSLDTTTWITLEEVVPLHLLLVTIVVWLTFDCIKLRISTYVQDKFLHLASTVRISGFYIKVLLQYESILKS